MGKVMDAVEELAKQLSPRVTTEKCSRPKNSVQKDRTFLAGGTACFQQKNAILQPEGEVWHEKIIHCNGRSPGHRASA